MHNTLQTLYHRQVSIRFLHFRISQADINEKYGAQDKLQYMYYVRNILTDLKLRWVSVSKNVKQKSVVRKNRNVFL